MVIIYNNKGDIVYTIENFFKFNKNKLKDNQKIITTKNENITVFTHYVENDKLKQKNDLTINNNPKKINVGSIIELTLESEIANTEIKMKINDIEFVVVIENNIGIKKIELQEPDIYRISCIDKRFKSEPIKIEVI